MKHKILNNLCNDNYFSNFTFQKNSNCFKRKTFDGFNDIQLYFYKSVDKRVWDHSEFGQLALQITPYYGVKFEKISNWFEKYSFKSIKTQRNNPTITSKSMILGSPKDFYFLESGRDFDSDYLTFRDELKKNAEFYFNKYNSLENYYQYDVLPVLNCEIQKDGGIDWVFNYLTAVKLVEPNRYNEMIVIVKKHIELMNSRNEPNTAMYNNKFDEIFEYLFNLNL